MWSFVYKWCIFINVFTSFEPISEDRNLLKLGTEILIQEKYRIFWHFFFWLALLAFIAIEGLLSANFSWTGLIKSYSFVLPNILATYFTIYFLVQRLLLHKKYILFFPLLFISAIFFSVVQRTVFYFIIAPLFSPPAVLESIHKVGFFYPAVLLNYIVNSYLVVALAVAIKLLKTVYKKQQINQMLIQQKLESELKFLKGQINPHFLFNSLNNLYGLALRKSDKTPEAILKLSSLLSYMLYECDQEKISLQKELEMLNNFIELQKLRYGDRLKIDFVIKGNVQGVGIAPMLFFPFVENSFKHGAGNELEDCWINICLTVEQDFLIFTVKNKKSPKTKSNASTESEGIGLQNIKRQLDLLYHGKYNLEITEETNTFFISLKLNLVKDENEVYNS